MGLGYFWGFPCYDLIEREQSFPLQVHIWGMRGLLFPFGNQRSLIDLLLNLATYFIFRMTYLSNHILVPEWIRSLNRILDYFNSLNSMDYCVLITSQKTLCFVSSKKFLTSKDNK